MSWSAKRQLFIIFLLCLFFGSIFGVYYYFNIRVPVSCTDTKQNQGELDVDCGGPCVNICESEILPLTVEWARSFKISNGKYDAAAVIVNRNNYLGISKFKYRLSLYDSRNVHVAEKDGEIFINPNEKVVIFESSIDTGEREATRAILEYNEEKLLQGWVRVGDLSLKPRISVGNEKLTEGARPSLSAEITNDSPSDIRNIDVSAVVYDENNNAMAVSSTFVSILSRGETQTVTFTWPEPFKNKPKTKDILPRIDYVSIQK